MLLAIDVGNTNTVFAVFDEYKRLAQWRCSTLVNRTADEYFVWLKSLMELNDHKTTCIEAVILSSVVPQVGFNLRILSDRYFSCRPLVVGKTNCHLPIDVRVDEGTNVGADRLVNTAGAFHRYGGNIIIIDFGTATTFDVVGKEGAYLGGAIAPGVNTSVRSLHETAAALPYVDISKPENVIGKNTKNCIQSGVFWGYIGLIEGLIQKIRLERNVAMKTVATGGLAPLFGRETKIFDHIDLDLTMHGMAVIYNYNQGK